MALEVTRIVLATMATPGKRGSNPSLRINRFRNILLQKYMKVAILALLCLGFFIHVFSPVNRTFFIPVVDIGHRPPSEASQAKSAESVYSEQPWLKTEALESSSSSTPTVTILPSSITTNATKTRKPGVPARAPNGKKRYILYRAVGNDLPPRHAKGQSLTNVRFILDNEAELPELEKRWIVNRIVDATQEHDIISLLESYNQTYIHLPVVLADYANISMRFEGFGVPDILRANDFREATEQRKAEIVDAMLHDKNIYIMDNNGARNLMVEDGLKSGADWVLPFDGNCLLTTAAWEEIRQGLNELGQDVKYAVVPMVRLRSNDLLMDGKFRPVAKEEPQIAFRYDAKERFNINMRYGRRPKVELLWRLGVPGPWMKWPQSIGQWEKPEWVPSDDVPSSGSVPSVGWVVRLSSGRAELEAAGTIVSRGLQRAHSVERLLGNVDSMVAMQLHGFRPENLLAWNETILSWERDAYRTGQHVALTALVEKLVACANASLQHGPFSVVYKRKTPPSRDRHDYYTPSPYYWPSPKGPHAKWIRRDGQRVPGTVLYDEHSEDYDRSRLASLFGNTTCLALGWYFTGNMEYAAHAATNIRTWFLDKETRMNPSMRYAQIRWGYDNNVGANYGIIETKDLYFLLDAVRLVHRAGALSDGDVEDLKVWMRAFVDYLLTSQQGMAEYYTTNNHGVYYDVQVASIAAFIGNVDLFLRHTERAKGRILHQFAPDGSLPEELARKTQLHYIMFGLQGWYTLGTLAQRAGVDLWTYRNSSHATPALYRGALFAVPHFNTTWANKQNGRVDMDRMQPLRFMALEHYPDLATCLPHPDYAQTESLYEVKPDFNPHDGIMPYWNLGLSLRELVP